MNQLLTQNHPGGNLYNGPLAPVIKKCLQLDPNNRYQSVDKLLSALLRIQNPIRQPQTQNRFEDILQPKRRWRLIPVLAWCVFFFWMALELQDGSIMARIVTYIEWSWFFTVPTALAVDFLHLRSYPLMHYPSKLSSRIRYWLLFAGAWFIGLLLIAAVWSFFTPSLA